MTAIYAELEDGSIVELEKDCGCLTHDGPHWLHMNDLDRKLIARDHEASAGGLSESVFQHFIKAETERLAERASHMRSRSIVRIVRERGNDDKPRRAG